MPPADPGVTVPPADPAANPAPAAPAVPAPVVTPGSEPVTNPVPPTEQTVPFARFQEVNDKAKAAEERATKLEEELAQSKNPPEILQNNDDELDPEVVDLINKSAKKLGYVTKEDLDAERQQNQVRQDIDELTANPPVPGIPYDNKTVIDYAKANNLPIISKQALESAYRSMNWDKIMEAERQRAIEGFQKSGNATAELPGSGGATPPSQPEITGKNTKERTRERIRNARQKLAV